MDDEQLDGSIIDSLDEIIDEDIRRLEDRISYHERRDFYRSRGTHRIIEIKRFINMMLRRDSCVDCGEKDIAVLEYDHIKGKKLFNISDVIRKSFSVDQVLVEARKCVLRCANCHRKKTYHSIWNLEKTK
jgi:hypothetical protein